MAPQSTTTKKRTFRRLKQFRCQGFGDCDMVFSRSEHLARHIRKHTGEKPFKCEFPDCAKQFSRFDNMRQHAQTHQRLKKHSNTDDVNIQPRPPQQPSQPIAFNNGGGSQGEPRTTTILAFEGREVGDQTAVTVVEWEKHNNNNTTTSADSPPFSPYSSTTSNNSQHGLVSPVSLSGTFEEQQQQPENKQDLHRLTQDELDALDGLNQFRQSPPQATTTTTTSGSTDKE